MLEKDSRPPGLSARLTSRSAPTASGMVHRVNVHNAVSALASGSCNFSASSPTNSTEQLACSMRFLPMSRPLRGGIDREHARDAGWQVGQVES